MFPAQAIAQGQVVARPPAVLGVKFRFIIAIPAGVAGTLRQRLQIVSVLITADDRTDASQGKDVGLTEGTKSGSAGYQKIGRNLTVRRIAIQTQKRTAESEGGEIEVTGKPAGIGDGFESSAHLPGVIAANVGKIVAVDGDGYGAALLSGIVDR